MEKRFSRRGFLKLAGSITMATAVAACAATPAPTPPPAGATEVATTPAEEKATVAPPTPAVTAITLRYRTWHTREANPGDGEWYDWLIANYPADHPGVTIEVEFVPFGSEYIQKVLADVAAGTPPDLLHSSIIWARDFYDRGVLLDLNDYLDQVPELAPDMFLGEATNEYRSKGGKYYGVPWEGPDSSVVALNSSLFEEAGFDPKGADIKTWDDFVRVAKALTKEEGGEVVQAGFLVGSMRYIEGFATWMYTNGGALHDREITKPTFNNERGEQVVQFQLDLLNTHKVSFPISPERQDSQLFMQGKTAMVHWGTWCHKMIAANAPAGFKYWLIPFPQGPMGERPAVTTWSNMFVLPKKTKNPDAAFELMRFCTTPPGLLKRFELSARTTPHKSIFESETWQKMVAQFPALAQTPVVAELGGVYPFFPCFTEANDAIGTELEQVMVGQKGVKEALAEAERKVIEVLERRKSAIGA
jgi:multiple sugar transport system substrate-binding protein